MLLKSAVINYLTGTDSRTLLDSDCTGSVAITYKKISNYTLSSLLEGTYKKYMTLLYSPPISDCFGQQGKKLMAT